MIKAFLSHSSKDKEKYVSLVANWLGKDNIIYDEMTFEEGEKTLDEIMAGLDNSHIFVLFLSSSALDSKWVKDEITASKINYEDGKINKIYPIVIEAGLNFNDPRIPDWIKENYNLRPIKRAHVAARRISQQLNKITWERHPELEKRGSIFVGRNDKLEEFEERIHDFDTKKPITIFTSGLTGVGRRTFLTKALHKVNIIDNFTRPSSIYLDRSVSIEDFIFKLNDLGLVDFGNELLSLTDKKMSEKQEIIIRILKEAYDSKEVIFILDDGCLINYKREVADWFKNTIDLCAEFSYPVICSASRYRVNFKNRPRSNKYFFIELSELNVHERKRLLTQLLDIYKIHMERDDFESVSDLLTGLPEQVKYAVDLMNDKSFLSFSDRLPILSEFNTDKASILLKKYSEDELALDFIRLLAQFEVITLEFIFSIESKENYYSILEDLISENICEIVGANSEMIRLNDIIRDYIKRNRLVIKEDFLEKINLRVKETYAKDELIEEDSSVFIFTLKEMLREGTFVDPKYLIPSHYLRCMKDIYNSRGSLDRVIELADVILQKERTMESSVVQDIRYYLCLALAKKSDQRILKEVQKIKGDEHTFLLGFYYRNCGRLEEALIKYEVIKNAKYVESRAKRELVQVYTQLEEYEKALSFAKKNYEDNKGNQFHAQAYFNCLINSGENNENKKIILNDLIKTLKNINSEQSNEMASIAEANYYAKIEDNEARAFDLINDCIFSCPDSSYPLLAKCDIALKYKSVPILSETVDKIEAMRKKKSISDRTIIKYKAYLLALRGDELSAIALITKEISRYPSDSKERILKRIKEFSTNM